MYRTLQVFQDSANKSNSLIRQPLLNHTLPYHKSLVSSSPLMKVWPVWCLLLGCFSPLFLFIFYMGFASRLFLSRITEQQDKGMLSSLPLPTASEFSKTITAESSPLQIVSGRTWTRNRWLLSAFCSNFKDVIIITSGLITLVRHNQFPRNCYWLVIGSTEQTFKMWLLQLRIVWTSINKTFSAPRAKQEWILHFFLARKPWRQKQVFWAK